MQSYKKWSKPPKVLMIKYSPISSNCQFVGVGLRVRTLRTQSSLLTEFCQLLSCRFLSSYSMFFIHSLKTCQRLTILKLFQQGRLRAVRLGVDLFCKNLALFACYLILFRIFAMCFFGYTIFYLLKFPSRITTSEKEKRAKLLPKDKWKPENISYNEFGQKE